MAFELSPHLTATDFDLLLNSFIDMLESAELQFGGSGEFSWSGIVQGLDRESVTESHRQSVLAWFNQHPHVRSAWAVPLRDAWYGW